MNVSIAPFRSAGCEVNAVTALTSSGTIVYENQAVELLTGCSQADRVGSCLFDAVHSVDTENIRNLLVLASERVGQPLPVFFRRWIKHGSWAELEGHVVGLTGDSVLLEVHPVSQPSILEVEPVKVSDLDTNLIDLIYGSSPIGLCFVSKDLEVVRPNVRLAQLTGNISILSNIVCVRDLHPPISLALESICKDAIRIGEPRVDVGLSDANGIPPVFWRASCYPIFNRANEIVGASLALTDSVERYSAEKNLREELEQLKFIANATGVGIWFCHGVGCVLELDEKTRQLFGLDEFADYHSADLQERVHPDDRELFHNMRNQRECDIECRVTQQDGSEKWIEIKGRRPIHPGELDDPAAMYGIVCDLTGRRSVDAEMQRHRNELAHITRVAVVGEMAASIAHDLNQPLGAILSNVGAAERILDRVAPGADELREILSDIREDDQRAGEVIRSFRALIRRRDIRRMLLDPNEVVRATARTLRPDAVLRRVSIALDLQDRIPRIEGDPIHLQQVLLNLVVNGMDAMADSPPHQKRLVISTRWKPNSHVEVSVKDNGHGFSPGVYERLFEPFFTTKPDGLGMGLSVARTIVDMHGGQLFAATRPTGGAVVRFTLPYPEESQ